MLFGKFPRRYLKQAGLRVLVFNAQDKEYQAALDEILDEPMVGRWDIDGSGKRLIDGGIIERFMDAIGYFISQQASGIDEGLRRERQWFYLLEAVRESLVNALAHQRLDAVCGN